MEKLNILVVDDEPGIRAGVKRILEKFEVDYPFMDEPIGFNVVEAETGEIAIDFLKNEKFDIVLLDNKLPGIQGINVLEFINQNAIDSKVVMITSYASLELAVKATKDGAIDFVPKPFTPQELRSSVENITKQLFLKKMTTKLNQAGKQIRFQFLSLLSHELKAPVNAVEAYLKMIKEKKMGDNVNDYIPIIERSLERLNSMKNMILDLLDFTKVESGQTAKNIQNVDLLESLKLCIATVKPLAIQKEIKISLCSENPVIYKIDQTDIEIVFNNLLSNAIKYNKDGGSVECCVKEDDKNITIVIKDTGIGISEEDQKKLFNEFVRIKNEFTQNISGSGLGLSIVKKILSNYNAEIKLESEINVGTKVIITLQK